VASCAPQPQADVASSGIYLAGLMKISGHKTIVGALCYVHTRDEEVSRAMKTLERRVNRGSIEQSGTPELHRQRRNRPAR
jgi:hypothetical protein